MKKEYKIFKNVLDTDVEFLNVKMPSGIFPEHYHKRNCAGKISEGEIIICFENKSFKYKKGDFFFIPAFNNHYCKIAKQKSAEYSVISYNSAGELIKLKDNQQNFNKIKQHGFMPLLNFALSINIKTNKTDSMRINFIMNYIDKNYTQNLTIKDLSKAINLSASRMQHVFKTETGMSLKQYILQEKIRRAKDIILHKSLIETALTCGFYDQSHFNKYFKKYNGLTPQNYVNSVNKF